MSYDCLITHGLQAIACMHDKSVECLGQEVVVISPDPISEDFYGDRVKDDTHEFTTKLLIDWNAWRVVLDVINAGEEIEENPVMAKALINSCIPKGSLIKTEVLYLQGIGQEYNTFRVVNNEVLSDRVVYGRRLYMVPHRGDYF